MLHLKRATLKQQLDQPEFESIRPILVGELKAIDMVINEFVQLFEIHESEGVNNHIQDKRTKSTSDEKKKEAADNDEEE